MGRKIFVNSSSYFKNPGLDRFDLLKLSKNYQSLRGPVYYIIFVKNKGHGFFSNFYHVLFHMVIADFYNWVPVVDMKNFSTLYNEKNFFFSTYNAWEYYFKQIKSLDSLNLDKDKIIYSDGNFPHDIFAKYYGNEQFFYDIFKKYISINKNIINKVKLFKKKNFRNNPIIGVHWRGTDIVRAKYKLGFSLFYKRRKIITIDHFVKKIEIILKKNKNAKIFLSTDEEKYLCQFKELYADRLVYTNCYRSNSGDPIHLNNDYPRKNHRYKLGLEVLIDSLLLAESSFLICRKSNVTNASILFNYPKKKKFFELDY